MPNLMTGKCLDSEYKDERHTPVPIAVRPSFTTGDYRVTVLRCTKCGLFQLMQQELILYSWYDQ